MDPESLAAALLAQADTRLDSGAVDDSWSFVRGALLLDPQSSRTLTYAGKVAVGRSIAPDAVRYFRRATLVTAQPDIRALLNLAQAQQLARRMDAAIRTATRAVQSFPDDVQARGVLASLHASEGDLDAAASALRAGDASRLGARAANRLGQLFAPEPRHRALSVDLLARAAAIAGQHQVAALSDLVQLVQPGDLRGHTAARRLLALCPDSVVAMDAVVGALVSEGKLVRAGAWVWQSCMLRPDETERLERAAHLTHRTKWPRHGIAANLELLSKFPDRHELAARICELQVKIGNRDAAVARGRQLLKSDPADPRIWDAVASMYKGVGAIDEALALWPVAIRRFPGQEVLRFNYSILLDERNDLQAASHHLRAALVLRPSYVYAANQLGLACHRRHRRDAALKFTRWSLVCDPDYANGHMNLGNYMRGVGDYATALAHLKRTEETAGKFQAIAAAGRYNAGMIKIGIGELEAGFNLLEARWATQSFPSPKRSFAQRIWLGPRRTPAARLLLYMEQGLGDEFMMSWYLPLLRRDTSRLLVDCDPRLVALFSRTYEGVEFVGRVASGHPATRDPDLAFKIPSFHVPQYYVPETKRLIRDNWDWATLAGTRFPSRLVLDPVKLVRWQRWMAEEFPGRPRVGVSWRSSFRNRDRDTQYVSIEELGSTIPAGSVAINLQYSSADDEIEELKAIGARRGFEFVNPPGVDLTNDLEDILAILQSVSAVVTPLISLAWMAGAVGCPAYIFRTSPERAMWHQMGTPFLPWAPSLKVFFRHPAESWTGAISDLRAGLAAFLSRSD